MSTRSPGLTFTVPSPEENSVRGRAASDLSPMSTITSVSVTLSTVQLTTSPAAIGDNRSMLSKRLRRSEEHTSELQSPCNLVCRLLLEKKKKKQQHTH